MAKETLTIDYTHYEVDQILEGGMGRVLLLTRSEPNRLARSTWGLTEAVQDRFRLVCREKLAAKTLKNPSLASAFMRECQIWLTFDETGIVPLLKVVLVDDLLYALMPRYSGSLYDVLVNANPYKPVDLLKALESPVRGLSALHTRHGIVHQDIKPENFLRQDQAEGTALYVSDWGMANVHASSLPRQDGHLSQIALSTMSGWGTLPYMAPERFVSYHADVRADIFSLGIVFYQILTGAMPYDAQRAVADQIVSAEFYHAAEVGLASCPHRVSSLVLAMIHPAQDRRLGCYDSILTFLRSL